jgi:hypothetical protein
LGGAAGFLYAIPGSALLYNLLRRATQLEQLVPEAGAGSGASPHQKQIREQPARHSLRKSSNDGRSREDDDDYEDDYDPGNTRQPKPLLYHDDPLAQNASLGHAQVLTI